MNNIQRGGVVNEKD